MLIHQIVNNAIFVVLEENFVYKFLFIFYLVYLLEQNGFLYLFNLRL